MVKSKLCSADASAGLSAVISICRVLIVHRLACQSTMRSDTLHARDSRSSTSSRSALDQSIGRTVGDT